MRLLIDTLIAVSLAAILGFLVWHNRHEQQTLARVEALQQSLQAITTQALYHAAIGDVEASSAGYALAIDARWFSPRPANLLLRDKNTPWLETTAPADHVRFNPAQIIGDAGNPAFWYNPARGVVRARVPRQISRNETVELYNLVNGTSLRVEDVEWDERKATVLQSAAASKPASAPHPPKKKLDPVVQDFLGKRAEANTPH